MTHFEKASKISISRTRNSLCYYFSPDETELRLELQWCFKIWGRRHDDMMQVATEKQQRDEIPFLLLPHGAYCDSGPLVADALMELDSRTGFFRTTGSNRSSLTTADERVVGQRTVVLIGTEHASLAQSFLSLSSFSSWRTPLGCLEVDQDLFHRFSAILPIEDAPFVSEHSIENQLPFLQYMSNKRNGSILIVPLSVRGNVTHSDYDTIIRDGGGTSQLLELAKILGEYHHQLQRQGGRLAVLATTDYSHVGPAYGICPPGWPSSITIPDFIRQLDGPILEAIQRNDIQHFWRASQGSLMCGRGAVLVWLRLHELLHGMMEETQQHLQRSPILLRYNVGSDIGPKHDDQTGFATFIM